MPRCPDCSRFVSVDGEQDADEQHLDVDPTESGGTVTAEVRLVLACADCSTELAETYLSIQEDFDAPGHDDEGHELSVEVDGWERGDYYQATDRHGKPIRNPRYQRHYYTVQGQATVRCTCQEEPIAEVELQGEEAASGFESLV